MTAIIPRTLGIDISKDRLDVHLLPEGTERQYANDASGLRELIRWLEPLAPARIVYEATGAYHRLLERMLGAKGLPLVKPPYGKIRAVGFQKYDALYINDHFYGHVDEFSNPGQYLCLTPGTYTVKVVPMAGGAAHEEKVTLEAEKMTIIKAK